MKDLEILPELFNLCVEYNSGKNVQQQKPISFELNQQKVDKQSLLQQIKYILHIAQKQGYQKMHLQSLISDWIISSLNGSMYTYQMAPCFTLMETSLYQLIRVKLGWDQIDGLMSPGATYGNMYGMTLSRYLAYPQSKAKGIHDLPPLRILTSEFCHKSILKNAFLLGSGTESVLKVKSNQKGQMIPAQLQNSILKCKEQGQTPYVIIVNIGSTSVGGIDNLEQISAIAQKHKIWIHGDATLSGVLIFNDKLRQQYLKGINNLDSIVWNAHDCFPIPLQATIFVNRHKGLLTESNSTNAVYLFHKQRNNYDIKLDTGDKSLQCGRHVDIMKLWTYMKSQGLSKIEKEINEKDQAARRFGQELEKNKWQVVCKNPLSVVCKYSQQLSKLKVKNMRIIKQKNLIAFSFHKHTNEQQLLKAIKQ